MWGPIPNKFHVQTSVTVRFWLRYLSTDQVHEMFVRLGVQGQLVQKWGLASLRGYCGLEKIKKLQTLPSKAKHQRCHVQRNRLEQVHFRRLLLDVQGHLPGKLLVCELLGWAGEKLWTLVGAGHRAKGSQFCTLEWGKVCGLASQGHGRSISRSTRPPCRLLGSVQILWIWLLGVPVLKQNHLTSLTSQEPSKG